MKRKTTNQWEEFKKLKRLWPFLREQRSTLILTLVFIPIIAIIQLIQPFILKYAVDLGIMKQDTQALRNYAVVFFILVVCEYVSKGIQSIATTLGVERMIQKMRIKLCIHLMHLPIPFHHRHLSGVLVTRSTTDFDSLSESLNDGVLQSAVGIVSLIGCIIGMISLNPLLGTLSSLAIPLSIVLINWFSQKIKNSLHDAKRFLASLNAYTQETLQGMTTVKTLVAESFVNRSFKKLSEKFRKAQMSSVAFDSVLYSLLDGISSITMGIILWFILARLGHDSTLSAGVIVAFVRYLQQMFDPLRMLGQTISLFQGVFTSTDRIFELFDQKESIEGSQKISSLKGSINFNKVSFSYPIYEKERKEGFALKNITLKIEPGDAVALVGPTGSGKSTLVKVLSKQYGSYQGELKIDGQELRDIEARSLKKRISIVPQDLVLFEGTLAFNISLGNKQIGLEKIEAASKLIGLHPLIESLPGNYEFKVDEEGSNLSVGQKQLIVFARALARDPDLIILDEASSALDPLSEKMVQEALNRIFEEKTVIVIAHRLSTIQHCNKIFVIREGEIAESGNHQELLQKKGLYFKLSASMG